MADLPVSIRSVPYQPPSPCTDMTLNSDNRPSLHSVSSTAFSPGRVNDVEAGPGEAEKRRRPLTTLRTTLQEPAAEFIGTLVLVLLGTAVDCQVVLSASTNVATSQKGSYLSISFGWGIATALGVWIAIGASGGHLNPAVSLVLALYRKFPARKLPVFVASQVLGAFTGSLISFCLYHRAIVIFEGGTLTTPGTSGLFTTFPLSYVSTASCFFTEFVGTAILVLVVFAVTDTRKQALPLLAIPFVLFVTVTGIGASIGMQTSYAINPARDLGPRLMTAIFYGREVFTYRNHYWIWTPILGPIVGAVVGATIYETILVAPDP
ncbi:hypothetical protein FRB90_001951 [Tulasnella sp. 427]|nr:hypothetical protein FRB90_001951 [Tulasnella sp. 427]